jgi:hypothetical protein
MTQWNDRIYYFDYSALLGGSDIFLSSIKTDGTDHRRDLAINKESGEQVTCILHRGRVYVMRDYVGEKPYLIQMYEIDHLDEDPVTIWENNGTYVFVPIFINDSLYYFLLDDTLMTYYQMDYNGENRKLVAEKLHVGMTVEDEGQLYQYQPQIGLFSVSYETGEQTVLIDQETLGEDSFRFRQDGEYLYLWGVDDNYDQAEDCRFLIADKAGTILEELTLPNMTAAVEAKEKELAQAEKDQADDLEKIENEYTAMLWGKCYTGVTEAYILASDSWYPNYYIERSEIGTGECEWKTIEMYSEFQ